MEIKGYHFSPNTGYPYNVKTEMEKNGVKEVYKNGGSTVPAHRGYGQSIEFCFREQIPFFTIKKEPDKELKRFF